MSRNTEGGRGITLDEWPVERLTPDPENTKKHTDVQVQRIAASINAYGFNDPIGVTPEGMIVEGHGRLLAAQLLGMDTVPVMVLSGFDERDRQLYSIAHNRLCMDTAMDREVAYRELTRVFVETEGAIDYAAFGINERAYDATQLAASAAAQGDQSGGGAGARGNAGTSGRARTVAEYEFIFDTPEDMQNVRRFLNGLTNDNNKDSSTVDRLMEHIRKNGDQIIAELREGV